MRKGNETSDRKLHQVAHSLERPPELSGGQDGINFHYLFRTYPLNNLFLVFCSKQGYQRSTATRSLAVIWNHGAFKVVYRLNFKYVYG